MQPGFLQPALLQLHGRFRWRVDAGAAALASWLRRAATRRTLRELDARALADIGISETRRRRECAKWFWQG
ncbi:MAG TPA: DUF1127 domain-containing protein [Alphaproteobacteria bacterium]|nr:DUF1127 domain-containing protein [Alphaproteobacteria bacterium]